jgi:hypothetical protein
MCFLGFSPSNSDGALFAQMGNRHVTLLPSKMLICAGRKALVVAVEMVNYDGLFKKSSTEPAQPTRPIMDISNATGGAFMILCRTENLGTAFTSIMQQQAGPRTVVLPFGPCLSGRISVSKSQDVVNEASGFADTAKRIGADGAGQNHDPWPREGR